MGVVGCVGVLQVCACVTRLTLEGIFLTLFPVVAKSGINEQSRID